jgi:hypothetical protein
MNVDVSAGQTYNASSGQIDNGDMVEFGGTLNVLSGGSIFSTEDKGLVFVSSGGTGAGTVVGNGGQKYVFGTESATGRMSH